ncbi:MAG TPA: D-2-hydroxyacid dehydrogenase family protein [bacterium]|nr:D-2-hydroxyacid dehydrogenase family protein [bacterium]
MSSDRQRDGGEFRVALLDDYQGVGLELADWASLGPRVAVEAFRDHVRDEAALLRRLAPFDAIVAMRERTPFPERTLAGLRRLRLLVTTGMRNASIDVEAATRLGIVVAGTDGLAPPTVELTWALILAVVRRIPQEDRATRAGRWQTSLGSGLHGKTLGVIGLGRLGSQVAAIGRAFGMRLLGWSQNLTPERAAECGAARVTKEALLERADVVTIHLQLSPRTRGLIGAADFARMKPTAYLVNTSRGPIVDEAALLEVLRAGKIAGAALDVYGEEPLPAEHPFLELDNLVLSPHLGYVTFENYVVFYQGACEDVAALLRGAPERVLNPAVLTSPRLRRFST